MGRPNESHLGWVRRSGTDAAEPQLSRYLFTFSVFRASEYMREVVFEFIKSA
jgi:hypothetical protein